jgi:hypothetical protein
LRQQTCYKLREREVGDKIESGKEHAKRNSPRLHDAVGRTFALGSAAMAARLVEHSRLAVVESAAADHSRDCWLVTWERPDLPLQRLSIWGIEKVSVPALLAVEAQERAKSFAVTSSEKALALAVHHSAAAQIAVEPSSVTVAPPPSKSVEAVAVALILSFDYEASTTADPVQISDLFSAWLLQALEIAAEAVAVVAAVEVELLVATKGKQAHFWLHTMEKKQRPVNWCHWEVVSEDRVGCLRALPLRQEKRDLKKLSK